MLRERERERERNHEFDNVTPWSGLLSAVAWTVHNTHYIILEKIPGLELFDQDVLFNVSFIADLEAIMLRK